MTEKNIMTDKVTEIIKANIEDFAMQEDCLHCDLTLIGMDSMKFISIIVELEEAFTIEFPDEYLIMDKMNTVCKITGVIESLLAGGAPE